MRRLGVVVEGATEVEFVKRVLARPLLDHGVNDDTRTAPSKRIRALLPDFRKRLHGPLVAENVGLARMRTECPRFGDWLARLERLGW